LHACSVVERKKTVLVREEGKNIQVQEVQKWITGSVQQIIFEYNIFNVLEKAVRMNIADRVAGWNWE
jgi:hypothetical protein